MGFIDPRGLTRHECPERRHSRVLHLAALLTRLTAVITVTTAVRRLVICRRSGQLLQSLQLLPVRSVPGPIRLLLLLLLLPRVLLPLVVWRWWWRLR